MTVKLKDEIKRCLFCNKAPVTSTYYLECECPAHPCLEWQWYATKEDCIKEWNTRADLSPPVPADVAESVKDYVHTSKLKEAFGMFLNGMAYYETFPDDAEDAKQLSKQATYNFLRARNHVSEEIADLCSMACKAVYTNEYEKGIIIRAASAPSADDKCPDCGSEMIEVCSGLEKFSREGCTPSAEVQTLAELHEIIPATPLHEGMTRDIVADSKRLVARRTSAEVKAENERLHALLNESIVMCAERRGEIQALRDIIEALLEASCQASPMDYNDMKTQERARKALNHTKSGDKL